MTDLLKWQIANIKNGDLFMYTEAFIKSLELDLKICNADTVLSNIIVDYNANNETEIVSSGDDLTTDGKATIDQSPDPWALIDQMMANPHATEMESDDPRLSCYSCAHWISDLNGKRCDQGINDEPESIRSCELYKRVKCEGCEYYEHSFCVARDGKKLKNPNDSCDFEAKDFL
jgi:hypothetical protein